MKILINNSSQEKKATKLLNNNNKRERNQMEKHLIGYRYFKNIHRRKEFNL